jgi:hypothetical protein
MLFHQHSINDSAVSRKLVRKLLRRILRRTSARVTKLLAIHPITLAFATEGDKFRNYASAWRDRWNSVMELFMAGGNYAASGVPFPNGFATAVDGEIATAK